ncbi:hypothetical protein OLM64_20855 [Pseudomonas aeruginosa]|uniref:hypothetical protein n=1 Tax=Pseudomonas aeruginosa TaxID=287 RepID=UPI000FFEF3C5|nr:hypothetical protein [Pseudomonas aeruginosa]MBA5079733.1 hypothetical protein [Pseudomonas aeruginosa]MCO3639691.1 hypothetical protein [Pseudomonas aeruginosa]MDI2267338.1 hypothetical protein [Pseudomonas aeruginosa]MDI2279017.1 hypothetical protein [Pseudomonas aeruginosa]MDI2291553.1 hypothetical protein [Pseudomonas aeruginosa]
MKNGDKLDPASHRATIGLVNILILWLVAVECVDFLMQAPSRNSRSQKGIEMKSSDKSIDNQRDRSAEQGGAQNSKVVALTAFKEKKADDEYRKAINKIIARAQQADW